MITSVDTQDGKSKYNNRLHNAGDFEYSIDLLTQDSNHFRTSSVVIYGACERQKRLCYSNRRSLFIDVPQIFTQTAMDLMTLGKSNFQIMKLG
jgi:hypothetical protein